MHGRQFAVSLGIQRGFVIAMGIALVACGSKAVGVDTCRAIEGARCRRAPECEGINLDRPVHYDGDVTACIRFYENECLHGLAVSVAPSPEVQQTCIDAINSDPAPACIIVKTPQSSSACMFLQTGVPYDASIGSTDN